MLSEAEFTSVAREMKARSGAVLTREMSAAAEQRLTPLARREGFNSAEEYLAAARTRGDARMWQAAIDALIQCETRFFRDRKVFQRLREDVLPELAAARPPGTRIKIWSAGCGSGQEAYSLALLAEEWRAEGGLACDILATDFSGRLLDKARSGLFTQFEVQRGLPIRKLISHFERAGDLWRITDRLRGAVKFDQHNLLKSAVSLANDIGGPFDIVLCRYVLGPMDAETRLSVAQRLCDVAAPDSTLIMGENEALPSGCEGFSGAQGIFARGNARRAA